MAAAVQTLPLGVGRVPKWWMEITPHYLLDVEEDQEKRLREAQLNYYYAQMAAADDAGMLGPDGKLILGPDGKPLTWKSGWAGRQGGSSGGVDGSLSPGGGHFQSSGNFRLDPKLFGIEESDPDYQSYLTGAKLPPGFMEKMEEMFGTESIPNNLRQTDYGRYGRQAEKPAFQPTWTKKKLRSTSDGANIRNGIYNDSPNKHHRRRPVPGASELVKVQSPPPLDSEPEPAAKEESPKPVHKIIKVRRVIKKVETAPVQPEREPEETAPVPQETTEPEPLVETETEPVPQVETKPEPVPQLTSEAEPETEPVPQLSPEPESIAAEPEESQMEEEPEVVNDVPETVSVPTPQRVAPEPVVAEAVKEVVPAIELDAEPERPVEPVAQVRGVDPAVHQEEEDLLSDEEIYEEEIIEDSEGEEAELTDLQAILAAKQAELARLQAQLES